MCVCVYMLCVLAFIKTVKINTIMHYSFRVLSLCIEDVFVCWSRKCVKIKGYDQLKSCQIAFQKISVPIYTPLELLTLL